MPKCKNCGNEFEGNFCPACGTKAEENTLCPNCGGEIKRDAQFCTRCGHPIAGERDGREKGGIRNETRIDVEFNLRASEHMAGRTSRIIMLASGAFLILFGVAFFLVDYFVLSGAESDIFFPLFCGVIGAAFLVLGLVLKSVMRKALLKNMQGKESTNAYFFTETGYEILTRLNDGTESTASGSYGGFTEAKEFKDMWLLYVNKATVFIVDKAGMTQGTAEELSALLSRAMGARYKVKYKK